jgi:hypothetical protein
LCVRAATAAQELDFSATNDVVSQKWAAHPVFGSLVCVACLSVRARARTHPGAWDRVQLARAARSTP